MHLLNDAGLTLEMAKSFTERCIDNDADACGWPGKREPEGPVTS